MCIVSPKHAQEIINHCFRKKMDLTLGEEVRRLWLNEAFETFASVDERLKVQTKEGVVVNINTSVLLLFSPFFREVLALVRHPSEALLILPSVSVQALLAICNLITDGYTNLDVSAIELVRVAAELGISGVSLDGLEDRSDTSSVSTVGNNDNLQEDVPAPLAENQEEGLPENVSEGQNQPVTSSENREMGGNVYSNVYDLGMDFTLEGGMEEAVSVDLEGEWGMDTVISRHPGFKEPKLVFVSGEVGDGGDHMNILFKNVSDQPVTIKGSTVVAELHPKGRKRKGNAAPAPVSQQRHDETWVGPPPKRKPREVST